MCLVIATCKLPRAAMFAWAVARVAAYDLAVVFMFGYGFGHCKRLYLNIERSLKY
jgi:hypothetical protein